MYPDSYERNQLANYATRTANFMQQAGNLSVLNIIGSNPSLPYLQPLLDQPQVEAILYYYYVNYALMNGSILWSANNKPIIGPRFLLWAGFNNPETLAKKLNNMPTNETSVEGYSLVAVHAWSMTVENVVECAQLLNGDVEIVTPGVFVQRVIQNLSPKKTPTN